MRLPHQYNVAMAGCAGMTPYEMRKYQVLSHWLQLQWIILPILVIPLAILVGMRRTNGAIIVSSAIAILAVVFTAFRNIAPPLASASEGSNILDPVAYQIGGVSLLAAWTLALAHAAQARRWRWFALLVVAGYLAYTISFLSALQPATICSFNPGSGDFSACPPPNIPLVLMLALVQAIGPVAILIYTLRAPGRRQRQLPEGLVVSSLHDAKQPGDNATPAAGG
jgi:hypothetical protein